MKKPFEGIKVVDFSLMAAGPIAGKLLADWGAEVIKVEPTTGEGGRGFPPDKIAARFHLVNVHKLGIAVDLKTPDGMAIMDKMLADADVFISSYRMKALVKMGLDYDTLHKKFPKLVWAHVSGYGNFGPKADDPGFDVSAFWANGGCTADWADAETNSIIVPPLGFGDLITGAIFTSGIMAALYQARETGIGQKITSSLYGTVAYAQGCMVSDIQEGNLRPATRKEPMMPLNNTFQSKDGKWFILSIVQHTRYYNTVMKALGRDDLIDKPEFAERDNSRKHSREITSILDEEFGKRTYDEIVKLLTENDIAFSPIKHTIDIIDDEQALANGFIYDFTDGYGKKYKLTNGPVKVNDQNIEFPGHAPKVGEHTSLIMKRLGYTDDQIEEMKKSGIVAEY